MTRLTIEQLLKHDRLKALDPEAAARLLSGAALNAALWVAASSEPEQTLPKAVETFRELATGLLRSMTPSDPARE